MPVSWLFLVHLKTVDLFVIFIATFARSFLFKTANMRSVSSLAAIVAALAVRGVAGQYDDWKFGNLFIAGPAKSAIKKATYTLSPPPIPCGTQVKDPSHQPWMSIWVGISDSVSDQSSDLYQPLLNWAPNNEQE